MEDTVLFRDSTEVFNQLESDKVSNVSSLSAFLATLNQSGTGGSRLRRFLDETGSLDVNVGDSSSCRLSDISSISYTNVTQDDNESLGCETNASLDNVIDSASSCRSDEESPYEMDQDEADYGLESSGYFGNHDLFAERPLRVDKSSMTHMVPSDDDIKNFMSPHDSIADLNSGLYAEIKRNTIRSTQHFDEVLTKYQTKDKETLQNVDFESSVQTFVDASLPDGKVKLSNFLQASSDDSSTELKEIFLNDSCNKVELKLNGMVGTKSAIGNCKGSKVTLEFYCNKNITKDKNDKMEVKDFLKSSKIGFQIDSSSRSTDGTSVQTVATEGGKLQEDLESSADASHPRPAATTAALKDQEDSKKMRVATRIRPSPGLAKRIEESKAEVAQEVKPAYRLSTLQNPEATSSTRTSLSTSKGNDDSTSLNSASGATKVEEKKKTGVAKALDFCNEDIESSLNEIRSILYGSRIGLSKSGSQTTNSSQTANNHVKTQTSSNLLGIGATAPSGLRESHSSPEKLSVSYSAAVMDDFSGEKSFCRAEEDERIDPKNNFKRATAAEEEVKPEVSVIDELLEELRMSDPGFDDDCRDPLQSSSPGVEMKGNFRCKRRDDDFGGPNGNYPIGLSVPHASEKKTFSLSPEATDCDSIDASSLISDEGKTSPGAMPVVEDGLSSEEDEGKAGSNEASIGARARKSASIHARLEHLPRVAKAEEKLLFPTSSSSGSVPVTASQSKQNGFTIKVKPQERLAVRKDIRSKLRESSPDLTSIQMIESSKDCIEMKTAIRQDLQRTDLFSFLISFQKSTKIQKART